MSEQTAPPTGPKVPSQRRLSGHLLISLILSFASVYLLRGQIGIFLLGVGPIIAGFLAFKGRKRALADPAIVGPRFALGCMAVALLALGFQVYALMNSLPHAALNREIHEKQRAFLAHLNDRDYVEMHALLPPSLREARSVEDLKAEIQSVFPGEQPIELSFENVEIREEDADAEEFRRRQMAFLSDESDEFEFIWPYRFELADGAVDIDIRMSAERTGYMEFVVQLTEFSARRVESTPAPEKPDGDSAEEKPPPDTEEGGDPK